MKIVAPVLCALLVAGAATAAPEFRLRHNESGKVLGPFALEQNAGVMLGKTAFSLVDPAPEQFHLKHEESGKVLGPFPLTDGAEIRVGKTAFSVLFTVPVTGPDETKQAPAGIVRPEGHPGLPQLGFAQSVNPEFRRQIEAAARMAVTKGLWQEHQAAADRALLALTATTIKFQQRQRILRILTDPNAGVLLLQSALVRNIGIAPLRAAAGRPDERPFVEWLVLNPAATESLLSSVKKEDRIETVLSTWATLWKADPETRDRYHALALACALVFDKPPRGYGKAGCDVKERYMDFRDMATKGRLKTQIDKLPAWELVWVVDAPVPTSELDWARKNINLSRAKWSRAYGMIKYRMSKAVDRAQIHDKYTLENILKEGGICTDQAYFGAITAKAHGIPAMRISGQGDRGGHAWFGYKASSREWDMEAGRYTSDNYAAGTTRDPQTGKVLKEQALNLLADEQRRAAQFGRANRLVWLAQIFLENDQPDRAALALELALEQSSRHGAAWDEYLAFLKDRDAPQKKWDAVLRDYRAAYRKYPDMLVRADTLETELLVAAGNTKDAAKNLNRLVRKLDSKNEDRTDLIVDHIVKQATVLADSGDIKGALSVYRKALNDHGGTVKGFKELARAGFAFGKKHEQLDVVARYIDSAFEKHHPCPRKDYFAMMNHASLMDTVSGYLREAGRQSESERMTRDAAKLRKSARAAYGGQR